MRPSPNAQANLAGRSKRRLHALRSLVGNLAALVGLITLFIALQPQAPPAAVPDEPLSLERLDRIALTDGLSGLAIAEQVCLPSTPDLVPAGAMATDDARARPCPPVDLTARLTPPEPRLAACATGPPTIG